MISPGLAPLVRRAWVRQRRSPARGSQPLQVEASHLALEEFGMDAVLRAPGVVNCCAAAILSRARLETTEISRGAARLIDDTDLRAVPSSMPALLRNVLVLEARDGARHPLWPGGAISVLCYPYTHGDGREGFYIAKLTAADRFVGGFWTPRWSGEDVDASVPFQRYLGDVSVGEVVDRHGRGPTMQSQEDQHGVELARIARFLLTLAVLWDARGTPLRVEEDRASRPSRSTSKAAPAVACASVRRVTLRPLPTAPEAPRADADTLRRDGDRAGVGPRANHRTQLVETHVRPHLQRYRCGPRGERVEYVFKSGGDALRWASERVTTRVGTAR